jgi:hypothetical protein
VAKIGAQRVGKLLTAHLMDVKGVSLVPGAIIAVSVWRRHDEDAIRTQHPLHFRDCFGLIWDVFDRFETNNHVN